MSIDTSYKTFSLAPEERHVVGPAQNISLRWSWISGFCCYSYKHLAPPELGHFLVAANSHAVYLDAMKRPPAGLNVQ